MQAATTTKKQTMMFKPVPLRSMTKNERKVAVAKDVLKLMREKIIDATRGTYFKAYERDTYAADPKLIGDQEPKLNEVLPILTCEVCAIGALFAGFAARFNRVKGLVEQDYSTPTLYFSGADMRHKLSPVFIGTELDMMENYFERRNNEDRDSERLEKLMKAIIRVKGDRSKIVAFCKR